VPEQPTEPDAPRPVFNARLERRHLPMVAVVIAQLIWLGTVVSRGWYLQADLSNLYDGADRTISWAYLREPMGGHFAPVMRLVYWVLHRIAPMDYSLTVDLRLIMQAIATVLMYRVIALLTRPGAIATAVTAGYAFSSLLLPGVAWMTTGLGFGIAQILSLLAIEQHAKFATTGRWQPAARAGLLMTGAVLTADTTYALLIMFPIISMGLVAHGTFRERLLHAAAQWRGWLVMTGPILVATLGSLMMSGAHRSDLLTLDDAYQLMRTEWLRGVGPALVGGPFRWFADSKTYVALYAPSDTTILLGQLAFIVLLIVGYQRSGSRVIAAWLLPMSVAAVSVLLVGTARFQASGLLIPITPRYSFSVAVPLAIAVACSLSAPANVTTRTGFGLIDLKIPTRIVSYKTPTIAVLLVCSSIASSVGFARHWSANPGRNYYAALTASARAQGPTVNVWDTPVPGGLISFVEPHHHVSDLLTLAGVHATYNDTRSEPFVVSGNGNLTKSVFLNSAVAAGKPIPGCGTLIRGEGTFDVPLNKTPPPAEWFVRIDLYQQTESTVDIEVLDQQGHPHSISGGSKRVLGPLAAMRFRLPFMTPSGIRINTLGRAVNICFVHVQVGGPFPAGGAK